MPDHAHEGDCIMPDPSFAGEYPGGVNVEIIADGRNVVGRNKGGYVLSDPREFGLLGVWDGHDAAADKGRIVVDSTWHHWFNVNLYGLQSENGDEYKDILAFYRNVAIWLAPKARQTEMRRAGTRIFYLTASMFEHYLTLDRFRPELFYPLGIYARDALGRIAPQCQSAAWWHFWLELALPASSIKAINKSLTEADNDPFERAAIETVIATAVGGAINGMAVAMHKQGFNSEKPIETELDAAAAEGGRMALKSIKGASRQWGALMKNLASE